jgi:hypothetical protein
MEHHFLLIKNDVEKIHTQSNLISFINRISKVKK